jgi:hypothetical protein
MRHPSLLATRLSTCAHSLSAPGANRQRKLNRSLNSDYPRRSCSAPTPHQLDLAYLGRRGEVSMLPSVAQVATSLCRLDRKRLAVRDTGDPELALGREPSLFRGRRILPAANIFGRSTLAPLGDSNYALFHGASPNSRSELRPTPNCSRRSVHDYLVYGCMWRTRPHQRQSI